VDICDLGTAQGTGTPSSGLMDLLSHLSHQSGKTETTSTSQLCGQVGATETQQQRPVSIQPLPQCFELERNESRPQQSLAREEVQANGTIGEGTVYRNRLDVSDRGCAGMQVGVPEIDSGATNSST
jgi:hypothetical protein